MKKFIALLIVGFAAVCTYLSLKALAEANRAAEQAAEDEEDKEPEEELKEEEEN